MLEDIKKDAESRMSKSLGALDEELKKLRTGRAHPSLLEHVTVEYYGSPVPLSQVANISIEDARTLAISVWEKDMAAVVEKAIINSDLGLNPAAAGQIIRVPVPPMTEERRRDMVKVVKGEGENTKIAIRNIRRDVNGDVKDLLKEKEISEDQAHQTEDEIQTITNTFVKKVDEAVALKEAEVMEI